jgi:branched-subunit amino acid transport protein
VNASYVALAVLMAAVTYPFRAVPMLVPQMRRLPRPALTYVRLAGPAILASLAAVSVAVRTGADGRPELYIGPEWIAVAVCVAVVIWRRNLLLGLLLAAGLMALLRALGWAVI